MARPDPLSPPRPDPGQGPAHWLVRVARRAGLAGSDTLALPPSADPADVWEAVAEAAGMTAWEVAGAVAAAFGTEPADLDSGAAGVRRLVPGDLARRLRVLPLRDDGHVLTVATSDPADTQAEQELAFASGRSVRFVVAPPQELDLLVEGAYAPARAAEALLERAEATPAVVQVAEEEAAEDEELPADIGGGPVVRLTDMILHEAIDRGASDVHVQPTGSGGAVRYRVDGVLRTAMRLPIPVMTRVISRIKIISRLDITDRLRPQDGAARIVVDGRRYDLRVSTVPAGKMEKAVVRILDPRSARTLDGTGIDQEDLARLRSLLSHRDGVVLLTGPTGSGKTTTLYAALQEIATDDVNIMTVEDPVEYELPGITQIQVEPKQGVTFASALRAILRQDPDVILIGEIRDPETAQIAAQASLTGHLVLATVHANDAVAAYRRLMDLGLAPGTIVETLRGSVAQRLLRTVCPDCSEPAADPLTGEEEALVERYGVRPVTRARGCEACLHTGFRGRTPVTEILVPTADFEEAVLQDASPRRLQGLALAGGMRTLVEAGLELVRAGCTTLEEVERVLGEMRDAEAPEGARVDEAPAPPAAPTAPPPAAAPADGDADHEPPHILVVDDDRVNRLIARRMLEQQGYRVTDVGDGSEAVLRLARGEHFDLMVLDLEMPTLAGTDVLRTVRDSRANARLPVIVLSGSTHMGGEIELLEAGADDYVHKPLQPDLLATRVRAALRRARM